MAGGHVPVTLGSARSLGVDADGFQVTRVRFPPLLRLPLHTHERATVAVILSGSFDGLMRSASHPCPPATVLTEPAGEPHGNLFERAGAEVLIVQPDPARLELLEPFARLLGEAGHIRDPVAAAVARRAAGELRDPDAVTPFAVEGLILELLARTARLRHPRRTGTAPSPHWLGEARALLHDRRGERLRVTEVAAAVGVHPVHLARVFRLHYGMPVGAYLRGLRLDGAARRLAGSDDAIAEIAVRAGFFDQSHFTRVFKRQFGLTPLAYRRAARQ
ncbi:MAG TPA: AraC family transcriptional regulator [Streptosporangiaceae bacterium]|nr:AraC family transcriptional regulator [Streptosporangiaceae bacterium]